MAKRLSSIFSISRDEGAASAIPPRQDSLPVSPTLGAGTKGGKLHKNRSGEQADLALDTVLPSLEPPPTFRETASGISSKPVGRPDSRDGRRGSAGYASPGSRESSRSRPQTPTYLAPPGSVGSPSIASPPIPSPSTPNSGKLSKKKSWLPGKTDKHQLDGTAGPMKAWIAGLKERIPYDINALLNGGQVPELWDERGDVLVHLFPQAMNRQASFKVSSSLFADSHLLNYLTVAAIDSSFQNMSMGDAYDSFGPPLDHTQPRMHQKQQSIPRIVPPAPRTKTVYLPVELEGDLSNPAYVPSGDDLELFVLYRNFFAFLGGGALIATPRQVSLYTIFMGISSILRRLQYSSADGSTWGDLATNSFGRYCDELRLADVRASREKTIEALVLGEQMKYWPLYNEGFVHAAGRLNDIKSIKSPKLNKVSPITMNRLERASLDCESRLASLRIRLSDFDFPSMFSGLGNSQTATEARLVRFKAWKLAFLDMRKFTLAQYRRRYGAWPPKASSKKNNFEESGLNRLVVKEMYQDFCDLYDMLVNRKELTDRTVDMKPMLGKADYGTNETIQHALRTIESEYDRSTPPVLPPIPFDTPLLPAFDQSFKGGHKMTPKTTGSKVGGTELLELLLGSYNRENIRPTPWIQEFMEYERKLGQNATIDNLVDNRCGQWLFIYAVLQALPMVAVDARDVKFTDGSEYFLFAAPRGGKPWVREDTTSSRSWYNVSSGGQLLSLSADVLDHQPEGVHRRSHCWLVANDWVEQNQDFTSESPVEILRTPPSGAKLHPNGQQDKEVSPFLAPHTKSPRVSPMHSPVMRPLTPAEGSPAPQLSLPKSASRTSMNAGYEQVEAPRSRSRPASTHYNPEITFDSILGNAAANQPKKKKW